jgi:uncharacterized protein (TIGR00369 family)
MDRLTDATYDRTRPQSYEDLRAALHPNCVICSPDKVRGLALQFALGVDDTVVAEFELDQTVEGYVGWPHGGITTSILDGAMTNWLFAHGLTCVTAELKVRFRHPVLLGQPARVTASLETATHPLYVLEAHIVQNSQLKTRATGRFMYAKELMGGL